jgi:uncharacterized protein
MTQINALKLQEQTINQKRSFPFQLKAYHQEKRRIIWQQLNDDALHEASTDSLLWLTPQQINKEVIDQPIENLETCDSLLDPILHNIKNKAPSAFLLVGMPQSLMKSLQIPYLKKLYTQGIVADIVETGAACRMINVLQEEQRDFVAIMIP